MLLYLFVVVAIFFYFYFVSKESEEFTKKMPPKLPYMLPVIGHLHMFIATSPHHLMYMFEVGTILTAKLGHIARVKVLFQDGIFITNPEDCCIVLNECVEKPNYPFSVIREVLPRGLFTAKTEKEWRPQRKSIVKAFNPHLLDSFIPTFNKGARNLVSMLRKEVGVKRFNHIVYFKTFTINNILDTILNLRPEDLSMEKKMMLVSMLDDLFDMMGYRVSNTFYFYKYFILWSNLFSTQQYKKKAVYEISKEILKLKKIQYEENKHKDIKFQSFTDILFSYNEAGIFSDELLLEEILIMIFGGYHTTALSMAIILTLVGSRDYVQKRIQKEIEEVFGDSGRDVEKQDLTKLVYLEAVIKEGIRLYPIAPVHVRYTEKELKLTKYTIPKNTYISLSLSGANRHPVWGKDSEVFNPDRWLDPSKLPKNPNALLSFSVGKRNCIGKFYAMMVMKICLLHVFRAYSVKGDFTKMAFRLGITLTPISGYEISIKERQK